MAASRTRRAIALGAALAALVLSVLAVRDLRTPGTIPFEAATLAGLPVERALDLVLQQETGRDVWASQGYSLYRSRDGGPFEKVVTVRPRFGEAWAGYSRWLRDRFGYQELVEVLPVREDLLVAFAGGDVFRVDPVAGTQEAVHRLRFFGRGEGRGVMAHGLTQDDRGAIYYGEYATAAGHGTRTARIWRSRDEGRTFEVAYEFAPGAVRHIHGVQWDPVGRAIWVSTGDQDSGSRVGFSRDGAASFTWIGEGSQDFRVCSLLFLETTVAWGTDADRSVSRVLRWSRSDGTVTVAARPLPGPSFYARPLDARSGVLGLAENDVASYFVGSAGEARKLFQWTLPSPPRRGPHPALRLARGGPPDGRHVYLNPLRTLEESAAIYRIPLDAVLARAAEPE